MNVNRTQLVIFGAIGAVVILAVLLITGVLPGLRPPEPEPFTLEVWGLDPPELWSDMALDYREKKIKTATINYTLKDPTTYEAALVNALASGRGPDIFALEDSELEKHADKVNVLADGTLGYRWRDFKSGFADGVTSAVAAKDGGLLGTPLALDTLALFYNRDYFNSANIPTPPRTWDEAEEQAKKLTRLSEVGSIQRSGLAVGTASNVEHAADILLALMRQNKAEIIDAAGERSKINSPAAAQALIRYASFANSTQKTYSWNASFDNSLASFARGEAAMAIGYARDVKRIAELSPQLNFDVAPLPQENGGDTQVNFGRFSVLAVSRLSKERDNAWKFLLWLQEKDVEKKYIDALGLPPARRDLAGSKPPREYLQPFYDQVLSARTLPRVVAGSLPEILEDTIEGVVNRRFGVNEAMIRAENSLNEALRAEE